MTQYRVPLFELMRTRLRQSGIQLRVLHGDGTSAEATKSDAGSLSWGERLPTRYFFGGRVCWQPFSDAVADSQLVIVTQENKLLNNLTALLSPRRRFRIAFWGHGRNMQSDRPDGPLESLKRWTTNRVDWWFAYTDLSARSVLSTGFPDERLTVLNNSIDTESLRRELDSAGRNDRAALRARFGLRSGPVGLSIGSLYAEKRMTFLLSAAEAIIKTIPDFQLVIAGEGPDRDIVVAAAAANSYISYVGSVSGMRKAELLTCADVMLNPGLVGLGILDAFVAGLPLITTDCGLHSPEISYLKPDVNGLMTSDDVVVYAAAVTELLCSEPAIVRLAEGAVLSGVDYSISKMAERFCSGIGACLQSDSLHR